MTYVIQNIRKVRLQMVDIVRSTTKIDRWNGFYYCNSSRRERSSI